jgi:CBS domain-containing protein
VMSADPITVQADTSLEDVATLFVGQEVSRLPVLEGGKVVGIISKSDIVRSLISE